MVKITCNYWHSWQTESQERLSPQNQTAEHIAETFSRIIPRYCQNTVDCIFLFPCYFCYQKITFAAYFQLKFGRKCVCTAYWGVKSQYETTLVYLGFQIIQYIDWDETRKKNLFDNYFRFYVWIYNQLCGWSSIDVQHWLRLKTTSKMRMTFQIKMPSQIKMTWKCPKKRVNCTTGAKRNNLFADLRCI